jgi:hypothetical protein
MAGHHGHRRTAVCAQPDLALLSTRVFDLDTAPRVLRAPVFGQNAIMNTAFAGAATVVLRRRYDPAETLNGEVGHLPG